MAPKNSRMEQDGSDEEKAKELIEKYKVSSLEYIRKHPEGDPRRRVGEGMHHCISNCYTLPDLVDYMLKNYGLEAHHSRNLFMMFVTGPGGDSYLRHSLALKRPEESTKSTEEKKDQDPDNGQTQFSAIKEGMEQIVFSHADALWTCFREGNDSKEGNEVAQHCNFQKIVTEMIDEFKDMFDKTVNQQSNLSQISERKCGQVFQPPPDVSIVAYLCGQVASHADALWACSREATVNNDLKEGTEEAKRCNFRKRLTEMIDELADMFDTTIGADIALAVTLPVEKTISSSSTESFQTDELSTLIAERKYEEAFEVALNKRDLKFVVWLCAEVEPLSEKSLSQHVILSLLQQLTCGIKDDTAQKLAWIASLVPQINPREPTVIALAREEHLEEMKQVLQHQLKNQEFVSVITEILEVLQHKLG